MKKQIRLLVENLFDDEFNNIYNDTDLDTEIVDEYINNYKVGDIYYKNKKPYAICCGDKSDFSNNSPRFIPINIKLNSVRWSTSRLITKKLKRHDIPNHFIYSDNNNIYKIFDDNGYKNTQIIKNKCNLNTYPIFKYICNFGDDYYLPAVDELKVFGLNINKFKHIIGNTRSSRDCVDFMSSTVINDKNVALLTIGINKYVLIINSLNAFYSSNIFKCIPFINVN